MTGSSSTPPGRWAWVLHACVALAAASIVFWPTVSSGLTRLQTDPGDTLLNHYILEHEWLCSTKSGYPGTFWSPPCYYPATLTLAYSENLLGTAPLYFLLRPFAAPVTAYALWMILVCVATYFAAAWVLRAMGARHLLAAFGAAAFAFGLPRCLQLGHQQLLPHLFAPLAVYCAWRLVTSPSPAWVGGLLAALFLQALSSVYLGWFLHLAVAIFLASLLAFDFRRIRPLASMLAGRWRPCAALLLGWVLLTALLMWPYHEANRGFVRTWQECERHLPSPADWTLPYPTASAAWAWLGVSSGGSDPERATAFPGLAVLALAVLALVTFRTRILAEERRAAVAASLATAGLLALFSVRLPGDTSLWQLVYHCVPGAGAIRAVGRIGLTAQLFLLVAGLLSLDALLAVEWRGRRWVVAGAAAVLVLGLVEQYPAYSPSFDASAFHGRAAEYARVMNRGTAAYVVPPAEEPWYTGELLAMWAGLAANRPVVNGYSGREPEHYPEKGDPEYVFGWLAAHAPPGQLWTGKLLYVAGPREPGGRCRTVLLEADHPAK